MLDKLIKKWANDITPEEHEAAYARFRQPRCKWCGCWLTEHAADLSCPVQATPTRYYQAEEKL